MTAVDANADLSRYCTAHMQHGAIVGDMRKETAPIEAERRTLLARAHASMEEERVKCVRIGGESDTVRYVVLKPSGRVQVTADMIVDALQVIQTEGRLADLPKPRAPVRMERAVAQTVKRNVAARVQRERAERNKTSVSVTTHKPRHVEADATVTRELQSTCTMLVDAHEKRQRARQGWMTKLKPTNETLKAAKQGVIDHLEHVGGNMEVSVRRRDADATTLVLRTDEEETKPNVGMRDMIAAVERSVSACVDEHKLSPTHVDLDVPLQLVPFVVDRFRDWYAQATQATVQHKLRVSRQSKLK